MNVVLGSSSSAQILLLERVSGTNASEEQGTFTRTMAFPWKMHVYIYIDSRRLPPGVSFVRKTVHPRPTAEQRMMQRIFLQWFSLFVSRGQTLLLARIWTTYLGTTADRLSETHNGVNACSFLARSVQDVRAANSIITCKMCGSGTIGGGLEKSGAGVVDMYVFSILQSTKHVKYRSDCRDCRDRGGRASDRVSKERLRKGRLSVQRLVESVVLA